MLKKLVVSLFTIVLISGCTMKYSFTGASIAPDVKTVSVGYFRNVAPLVNPKLSQQFTESLKDKLLSETSLRLTSGEGDLMYEGEIIGYDQTYQGIQANETAQLNKLTITVKIRFTNNKDPLKTFEKTFSKNASYDANTNFNQIEDDLVKQIVEELLTDIFSNTVADW